MHTENTYFPCVTMRMVGIIIFSVPFPKDRIDMSVILFNDKFRFVDFRFDIILIDVRPSTAGLC